MLGDLKTFEWKEWIMIQYDHTSAKTCWSGLVVHAMAGLPAIDVRTSTPDTDLR